MDLTWIAVVALGYLLGGIPVGLIVGKATKGIDIRQYGSGKVGATNTLRTLGWGPSAVVLLLDMGKAAASVELARMVGAPPLFQALAGLAAVVGHCWSLFIGFNGGRGVAASLGSALVISPIAGLVGLAVFGLVTWRSRYVSLGSLSGAIVGSIVIVAQAALGSLDLGYAALAAAAVVVVVRHLDNIGRLRAGTERKLGEKASRANSAKAVGRPEVS